MLSLHANKPVFAPLMRPALLFFRSKTLHCKDKPAEEAVLTIIAGNAVAAVALVSMAANAKSQASLTLHNSPEPTLPECRALTVPTQVCNHQVTATGMC